MGRLLAIMILYNPDVKKTVRNIEAFINDVDHLLLWQNSKLSNEQQIELKISEKIEFVGDFSNKGISTPLNFALSYALSHDYGYLLTMDQDSLWVNFSQHKNDFFQMGNRDNCIVGVWQKGASEKQLEPNFYEMRWVITSGTIIPVKLLSRIGGYQEHFFVDSIDIELCLRAKINGFNVVANKNSILRQTYGSLLEGKLLGRNYKYQFYKPSRIKDIFSNLLLLYRKYKKKELLVEVYDFSIVTWKSILLNRKYSFLILKSYCLGMLKGLFMKQVL